MSESALAAIFAASFAVGFTGALMPGPLTTLAVRETMRHGFWAGPLLALGHSLIELALVIGLALGLSRLLDEDAVKAAIGIAGGLFLLWMGFHIMGNTPQRPVAAGNGPGAAAYEPSRARRWLRLLTGGATSDDPLSSVAWVLVPAAVLVSVSNPAWVAWWASVGTTFVSRSLEQGAAGVAFFYTGHILSDTVWLVVLAFVLATGRRMMSGFVYRGILAVCGLFLLGLGSYFLASGLVVIS
jgi:threonine/homoserine/homoserine lactone efflux protein